MRISDWSSDVCSSDLVLTHRATEADGPPDGVEDEGHPQLQEGALHAWRDQIDERLVAAAGGHRRIQEAHGCRRLGGEEGGGEHGVVVLVEGLVGERGGAADRSEEHTSELQSLMRISYAVFCLTKNTAENIKSYTPI